MSAIQTTLVQNSRARERGVTPTPNTAQRVRAEANGSPHDHAMLVRVMDTVHRVQSSTSACVLAGAIVLFEVATWIAAGRFGWRGDPVIVAVLCAGLLAAFVLVLPRDSEVN